MAFIQRVTKAIIATASGGATQSYNTSALQNGGDLLAIAYTRGAASAPSTAAGITITGQQTGLTLLDVSATGTSGVKVWFHPRVTQQDTSGVAYGFTSNATPPGVPSFLPIAAGEAINIDIASATAGGTPAAGSGGLRITFEFLIRGG